MRTKIVLGLALFCAACGGSDSGSGASGSLPGVPAAPAPVPPPAPRTVTGITQAPPLATFANPWALKFLANGDALVTQRSANATISVVKPDGQIIAATGMLANDGLLDIVPSPFFSNDHTVFFSYMDRNPTAPRLGRAKDDLTLDPQRMAVARAQLTISGSAATLSNVITIWAQSDYIVAYPGSGEPGGRITFSPDTAYLFISSGDRQELDPAYLFALDNNLGKMIRIFPDGSIPVDNPFVNRAGARPEIWSLGHRNAYGLTFSSDGRLWSSEMGPKGGDEFNLIQPGLNYGWPKVSYGDNYDGSPIPKPVAGDGFEASKVVWTPVIAPAGMIFYRQGLFENWANDAILTGLQSQGLVRVAVNGTEAREVERFNLGARVRDIAEAPDGSLWIITDGATGKLIRLTPTF